LKTDNSSKPIWVPSNDTQEKSNLTAFISHLSQKTEIEFENYNKFYEWSVQNHEDFWRFCLEYSGSVYEGDISVVSKQVDRPLIPRPAWFPNVRLNFAENLLKGSGAKEAVISVCEGRKKRVLSWDDLHDEVRRLAGYLIQKGVRDGDRVAGFVLNTPETLIAMLATASIGAVWSSCSPDFGFEGVVDRFGQIEPKVFVAVNGYFYGGRQFDTADRVKKIAEVIDSIENTVVIDITGKGNPLKDKSILWTDIPETNQPLIFKRLPFDHPLYIMYSSGTTGKPKCIVHGAGGTLLQHWKEHHLHTNVSRGTIITYFTTCGWMMWNWLVSALSLEATLFMFDGSPAFPKMERLWREVSDNKVNIFGTSPKFLSASEKAGLVPKEVCDLSKLDSILSTGSPLTEVNFDYVYKSVKNDVRLSSISGGTDIISCFMLGNPNLPVFKGEIQCRGLGMSVKAYDPHGAEVIGEKGELVCDKPFPSMPIYFWRDEGDKRYHTAYFNTYPDVWQHGDFIEITDNGGVIVYGRSDATLNPGGIRIGTAEIYRIVEAMHQIKDSVCVGLPTDDGDVEVVLFIVLQETDEMTEDLVKEIKSNIRKGATPRHVPAKIYEVSQIPVTISGKKVEIAVANCLRGIENQNLSALANPESLNDFTKYRIT